MTPVAQHAYYNEHDKFTAEWLRRLIRKGLITDGEVDERNIQDVKPDDLVGFTRCHFFVGVAGWDYALRLADWPADQPVWTGSCPCQSFSVAGSQTGKKDSRHLWPIWMGLIRERRPARIFGEQVNAAIAHGWMDEVAHDMEAEGYAVAAAVLPACSVGAPHQRDRLLFVANHERERRIPFGRRIENVGSQVSNMGRVSRDGGSGLFEQNETLVAKVRDVLPINRWETEPDVRVLVNGVPGRVGRLRGYGNSIVPQAAAEFIKAAQDVM